MSTDTPTELCTLQGELPTRLAQRLSDAIYASLLEGMESDEACCIAVAVIADYARGAYGNDYLRGLARIVIKQAEKPMPRGPLRWRPRYSNAQEDCLPRSPRPGARGCDHGAESVR